MPLILLVLAVWLADVLRDEAASADLCAASWARADDDGDGVLDGREATVWLAMMHLHKTGPPDDGRIDRTRFIEACVAGAFRTGYR